MAISRNQCLICSSFQIDPCFESTPINNLQIADSLKIYHSAPSISHSDMLWISLIPESGRASSIMIHEQGKKTGYGVWHPGQIHDQGCPVAGIALWHSCHAILSPFRSTNERTRRSNLRSAFSETPRHFCPLACLFLPLTSTSFISLIMLHVAPVVAPRLSPFRPLTTRFGCSCASPGYERPLF